MAKASDNLFPSLLLTPGAAPASPAAGSQRIYLDSADGNKLKRKASDGTVTTVEGATGGSGFTPKVKRIRYAGTQEIKVASTTFTSFVNSDGTTLGTALDLVLPSGSVNVGDTIECGSNLVWRNDAVDAYVSFGSIVSNAIVNTFFAGPGIPGAWGPSGAYANASGSDFYIVQSSDLSSGALTVRPLARGVSATAKFVLCTNPNNAVVFWVKNWGPQ